MQDFKKLRVWHLAQELSVAVIEALSGRAVRRVPGLRNQAVRAANSVAANLAEGCGRPSRAEFLRFVGIAIGSANELEAHLGLASRTSILSAEIHATLKQRLYLVRRMLISLMRALEEQIATDENQTRQDTDRAS
jgi:four helix bundle protein